MVRRKITVSDKTKGLFKPFFDVSSYKEKKEGFEEEEYKRLVELCFESMGKGKLSINRPMVNGKGILTFIYRTDKDLLLEAVECEKREIGSIMVNSSNNNKKRGRLWGEHQNREKHI